MTWTWQVRNNIELPVEQKQRRKRAEIKKKGSPLLEWVSRVAPVPALPSDRLSGYTVKQHVLHSSLPKWAQCVSISEQTENESLCCLTTRAEMGQRKRGKLMWRNAKNRKGHSSWVKNVFSRMSYNGLMWREGEPTEINHYKCRVSLSRDIKHHHWICSGEFFS